MKTVEQYFIKSPISLNKTQSRLHCLNKILEKYNKKVLVGILRESFLAIYVLLLALLSAVRYRAVLYFTWYNRANSPIHTHLTIIIR